MLTQLELLKKLKKEFTLNGIFIQPEFIETNSSLILFTDKEAFKIIKQDKGQDYIDLQSRHYWLQEELRINSEISLTVYEKVRPIFLYRQQPIIGDDKDHYSNKIGEYALHMKRLKQSSRVYNMLMGDRYNEKHSNLIAKWLANFHLSKLKGNLTQEDKNLIKKFASLDSLERIAIEDFERFEKCKTKFIPIVITESRYSKIKKHILHFLQNNKILLIERINSGYVLPIHGDFHAMNMFIEGESFYVIDRALRKKFRVNDILKDIAYLSVNLEVFGLYKEADILLNAYQEQIKDPHFEQLLPFYKCHLAFVGGVVNSCSDNSSKLKAYFDLSYKYANDLSLR